MLIIILVSCSRKFVFEYFKRSETERRKRPKELKSNIIIKIIKIGIIIKK